MLTEIRLENFKCFREEVAIPLRRLTLLTGINGKGKSTTLQALLLLHQSVHRALERSKILDRIDLNGRYVHLGSFPELQHRDRPKADPVKIGLELVDADGLVAITSLSFKQEQDDARWAGIERIDAELLEGSSVNFSGSRERKGGTFVTLDLREHNSLPMDLLAFASRLHLLGRMHYVSADRLGPQDFFPWSNDPEGVSVGVRGERTAEVLFTAKEDQVRVADSRARSEAETPLVTDQTSAWLSYVFDGGAVRVLAPHGTILTLEMNTDGRAHYHRPVNLGFGYSYILPILVAGLIAQPGEFLVVENPEAHLHPGAQSRMGEFLAAVSAAGVQVFVESHSEHILNAFRLAVKSRRISTDDLSVLYFRADREDPILRVPVEPDGRLGFWPDGFFDQRTRDLDRLLASD